MKKILFTIFTLFLFNAAFSQEIIKIEFTKDKELLINSLILSKLTTISELNKILGEPTIYKFYRSGKINYHFKEKGITVQTFDNKLIFIGLNFNWDGDATFPQTSYTGTFNIADLYVDKNSSNSIIENIKVVEIKCILPTLCMSDPKKESTPIIIGFKNDLVTQIGFQFH
ncbi:hypothetical protein [Lacinutrix sp.]|uniref:DUF7738 domain-containing protein n=1 Tax=Lacinutrix sp. TaxID=1937692 RepID=UPI0025C0136F|nr:hypothetical protein [Lacinutrix sp.]